MRELARWLLDLAFTIIVLCCVLTIIVAIANYFRVPEHKILGWLGGALVLLEFSLPIFTDTSWWLSIALGLVLAAMVRISYIREKDRYRLMRRDQAG